ncbi:MAG: hypothetical protein AB8V23_03455 [Candidatus Midichloria sp.]|uniref:Uncharacterized protein n=1 Tax=Hyalomma marginatum TaxID=34627 RepID=A0A8S4C115_9ACAR|nr:hypothetical protein MHYMCMPSP_00784 [Hyalomma marginatum]CAG7595715.1 hypothetical protein MHYMCMPASI_00840 [Hyalomma marginatum]
MLAPSIALRGIANLAVKSPGVLSVVSKTWENATLESAPRSAFQNMAAFGLSTLKEQSRAGVIKIPALFNIGALTATTTSIAQDIVKDGTSIFGTQAVTSAPEVSIPNLLQTAESAVQDTIFSKISSAVSASSVTDVTRELSQAAQSMLPNTISGVVKNFISVQSAAVAPTLSELTELSNVSTAIEQSSKTASKAASAISAGIENILPDLRYLLNSGSVSNAASAVSADIENILPDLRYLLEPDSTADSLMSIPRKFPTLQEPVDFSKMFHGEEPEFIKNFMEYLYSSGSYLCGLAASACYLVSTALYNSYTYLYNFVATTYNLAITAAALIKDVAVYTYNGLSYAKDFVTFCVVDHPYIVTGIVAFAVSAYLIKKYHLLDYAKTTAEVGYCGIGTAVQIGCNTTVAAFSGAYYLVDSIYSACQKTWEYFSTSNDCKDNLENDYTETCFCEY